VRRVRQRLPRSRSRPSPRSQASIAPVSTAHADGDRRPLCERP
jgi:hypothetical protein